MLILIRSLVYGSAFVGFVLVFLPARMGEWTGAAAPTEVGPVQWAGAAMVLLGIVPMAWSVLAFVFKGRGTPALYYLSPGMAGYVAAFVVWAHLFVVRYEEPRLRRTFGEAYDGYCRRVRRWLPRRRATG